LSYYDDKSKMTKRHKMSAYMIMGFMLLY